MTWNPVFGIQYLGLRIWDLDSSFYPNLFSVKILFDPIFFWTKFFVILDLGFGIEDLGLRIWDLDSSLPTDPFDQLGVA